MAGALLALGCGMAVVTSEQRDWAFIQSVGGLAVGESQKQADGTHRLPINCDVSGLKQVTIKPTLINSALAVRETCHAVRGQTIQLWIKTCVIDSRHSPAAPDVVLKNIPPGRYQVQYRNRDGSVMNLREIEIK
jgi:hypothetical protein